MSSSEQDAGLEQANCSAERYYLMGAEISQESNLFRQQRSVDVASFAFTSGEGRGKKEQDEKRRRGCLTGILNTLA